MCGLWEQACGLKENITACVTANPGDGDSHLQARCEPLAGAGRNLTSRRVWEAGGPATEGDGFDIPKRLESSSRVWGQGPQKPTLRRRFMCKSFIKVATQGFLQGETKKSSEGRVFLFVFVFVFGGVCRGLVRTQARALGVCVLSPASLWPRAPLGLRAPGSSQL